MMGARSDTGLYMAPLAFFSTSGVMATVLGASSSV
jgi:hypothetical protein